MNFVFFPAAFLAADARRASPNFTARAPSSPSPPIAAKRLALLAQLFVFSKCAACFSAAAFSAAFAFARCLRCFSSNFSSRFASFCRFSSARRAARSRSNSVACICRRSAFPLVLYRCTP